MIIHSSSPCTGMAIVAQYQSNNWKIYMPPYKTKSRTTEIDIHRHQILVGYVNCSKKLARYSFFIFCLTRVCIESRILYALCFEIFTCFHSSVTLSLTICNNKIQLFTRNKTISNYSNIYS